MVIRSFAIVVAITSVFWLPLSNGQDKNTVVIIGHRNEVFRPIKGGRQAISVLPNSESGFDTNTYLKSESSLTPATTGHPAPSGFAIARIRGQEAKVSEVYFEDFLLQDPYSGLPLVDDIDLRAFGRLEIFQGISPISIPSTNPIGAMVYLMRPIVRNRYALGAQFGKPYGASQFASAKGLAENENVDHTYQLYLRNYASSGRYTFYNDNGTPYNKDDDFHDDRRNNQEHSQQVVPFYKVSYKNHEWTYLGWWHQSVHGLPTIANSRDNHARERSVGHLNGLSWKFQPQGQAFLLPQETVISGYHKQDAREVVDEHHYFLPTTEHNKFDSRSNHATLKLLWTNDIVTSQVNADYVAVVLENRFEDDASEELGRRTQGLYAGIRTESLNPIVSETKITSRYFSDRLEGTTARRHIKGIDQTIAGGNERFQVYGQAGRDERAASLLEQFGNGSGVQPNNALEAEVTRHFEIGLIAKPRPQGLQVALAAFQDETAEKIVFVPGLANSSKAVNLEKTRLCGIDAHISAAYNKSRLELSGNRYEPQDLSVADEAKQIPNVPKTTAVIQLERDLFDFTFRWLSRYRSKVYRDQRNTIQTPSVWISDAILDYGVSLASTEVKCGLGIYNVFNVQKVGIEAPDSGDEGYTGYSEINGYPLPGRHWKTSVAVEF